MSKEVGVSLFAVGPVSIVVINVAKVAVLLHGGACRLEICQKLWRRLAPEA